MRQEIRILILEDVTTDAELVERELRKAGLAFSAKRVETREALLRELKEFVPDIILSDYNLPQLNALDALLIIRENKINVPFILVTGSLTEEVAVECMKQGADDYILKSSLKRLPSAVLKALEKKEAEQEKERAIEALRKSEERFQLVARATNDAIWDWDLLTNTIWWNQGVQILFGYSTDGVGTDPSWWYERIHPDDQNRVASGLRAFIHGDAQFWSDEYRYRRADDSYALVIDRGFILRDERGSATRMISSMMDITERKQTEERINYLAYYDALTGLPNRTLFEDRLPPALALAQRNQHLLAVMFLDLDRFKAINDTLGHAVGDNLLHGVAERLAGCVRGSDTVARFGGDEFALLLMQISRTVDAAKIAQRTGDAIEIAHNILEALKPPFTFDGHELYITASIGIGLYPDDGRDKQTLLKNAGAALYRAKEQGGNNYQFYTADMNARALKRLTLENSLHRALVRGEFLLHYQPQVEIGKGRVVGLEALVRWRHPDLGLISPAEFIPLAEDTGLIGPIGEFVLRTACAQYKSWQEAGLAPQRISVNLSAHQFQHPSLVEMITKVLEETGLRPDHLELELTESSIMKNAERAIETLRELKEMRIQVSIDDFGAGYSSLSYLKQFPIDRLKIDQSFVRDTTTDPADAAIIMAIITLAQNLRLKVIAEGVETEEQLRFLHLLRCDEMQGYLFSPPLPAEALKQLLLEGRRLTLGASSSLSYA